MRRIALAWLCAATVTSAAAHDSWFTPLPPTPRGQLVLALGTGTAYPRYEVAVAPQQLADSGCVGDGVREKPLRDGVELSLDGIRQWFDSAVNAPPVLALRTGRPVSPVVSVSCWARLVPIDIDIDDPTVDIYLDEVQALPAVRERWAALKARGVRWQETYVKHARIELDGEGDTAAVATPALPALGLDLRVDAARRPLRAGDSVRFQLLRDGQPLAGQPLQLVGDGSGVGVWRRTDAEGRLALRLPAAGRWLLRGTELRPAPDGSDRWDSRFVTLAFEVKPAR
ncbi:DUF4198 domain-containing protein [Rubrivivax albus]|uniref:DUF4198 domain-containing protein n=1 Tax=Rubrivivax albus TaxID=2499835 RepID=A0A3S2VXC1_9BURK|nr:DUF4198 domain-containing protein [Rubrivivax albus]RVT51675.1 DUF4198 domain-containing protein [Rubrivivax albus]